LSQFTTASAGSCGVLVTREFPRVGYAAPSSGLSILKWDGNSALTVVPLTTPGVNVNHWEHVTFGGGTDCSLPLNKVYGNVFSDFGGVTGVKDAGEPGIPGITITLTGSGGYNDSVPTDASGNYLFQGLAAGTYFVTITTPAGYVLTTAGPIVVTSVPPDR